MMNQDEKRLQNLCESYLTRMGILYFHPNTKVMVNRRFVAPVPGMTSWPDLMIFIPKRNVIFVELKTEIGKLTPGQKAKFEALADDHYPVHIIRDFQAFQDLIVSEL